MESPKITLRPFNLSDVDAFMAWAGDDRVSHFAGWDTFTSKDDALNYIRDTIIPHPWYRAICLGDRPVRSVSVKQGPGAADRCRASIGYGVAHEYWGRGIATRAVEVVVSEWPHLMRLDGLVDVENLGSQRVLEKAGFVREGVLRKYMVVKGRTRDMVMYSVTRDDGGLF
ncbi:hypothetical protein QJS04_geneDACA000557 [Acorus gramineus]|uniref:N-acetyltransferase domain-containing protein n=1 Tax=Acorus gramineus TaxID=55184 RepID=A0AAV9AUE6_ACOGR|nr:hypothetical protein QJS04_geneDACA000557 [Acorus gramineus]